MREIHRMPGHLARRFQQIAVAVFHDQVSNEGLDLTPVQFAALYAVTQNPGIDQATLAGLIAYDRPTIAGVVERLVQKGLISRSASKTDRRATVLNTTEQGRSTLKSIWPAVNRAQDMMLQGLNDNEKDTFLLLLEKAVESGNNLSRAPQKLGDATRKQAPKIATTR